MHNFKGRVAVVTGAASGIGKAVSVLLAKEGCDLALVDLKQDNMAGTKALVEAEGRKVSVHEADVSDKKSMQALPEEVIEEHGHVHIIMNNAGINFKKSIEDHSIEDFELMLGVNLWGVIYGCHFFLPYLKKETEAHIINTSSMLAFMSAPSQGSYSATKAAVKGLSEALWAEMTPHNIGVTCVHPGAVSTNVLRASADLASDKEGTLKLANRVDMVAMSPEKAALKILNAVKKKKMRVLVGPDAIGVEFLKRLIPVFIHKILALTYRFSLRKAV